MHGLTNFFKAALRRHMVTTSGLMLVTLAAFAPAHAQTSVQNTATVALPPGSPVVDSNAANNTSTATVGVLALPRLTLVKQVVNDNGGTAAATAWTLVATGTSRTISGATGTAAVTGAAVPAGTYALSETGGPAAYTASTWSCVKNGGAAVSANTPTSSVVTRPRLRKFLQDFARYCAQHAKSQGSTSSDLLAD